MLCRNCNQILTGKENFCPNCGTVPQATDIKKPAEANSPGDENTLCETEKSTEKKAVANESSNKENPQKPKPVNSIFTMEDIDFSEPKEKKPREIKKKSSAPKIMLLLLLLCIISAFTFFFADYFGIAPAISNFFTSNSIYSNGNILKNEQGYNVSDSIVEPEINYSLTNAFVSPANGITVRKGPSDSYAPLYVLPNSAQVQIFGGSLTNENWVYVYCPLKECYGWVNSSYLQTESLG